MCYSDVKPGRWVHFLGATIRRSGRLPGDSHSKWRRRRAIHEDARTERGYRHRGERSELAIGCIGGKVHALPYTSGRSSGLSKVPFGRKSASCEACSCNKRRRSCSTMT